MDKVDSKNNVIKLTFLEINPPLNELSKSKEELKIIFQGHDNFYDFKKCLSLKTPITLNHYKNSIIMTLLKSNNIIATGLFIIRPGEQNVIFNYENKKKFEITKAVNINNLQDCIRIKILCQTDNNNIIINNDNSSLSKKNYIPKVNLMKSNNNNNNMKKKVYDKKKKNMGNFHINNSNKKNFNISSLEHFQEGDYSSYFAEEMNNLKQTLNNNNNNINEIKKLNTNFSKDNYNNFGRKTEFENSAKNKNIVSKAKSKNYFNTIKMQYKAGLDNHNKLNNSSQNLMNQCNNKLTSIYNNENISIRNNLKPTISFNKNTKRKANKAINNYNNQKNLITSLDNFISGQITKHVDISKKENMNIYSNNMNNSEKKDFSSIHKNINKIGNMRLTNKENKIKKLNNITMNSTSTAVTKKNELEYSMNGLQYFEDENNTNKNTSNPFTNRLQNQRLQKKLNGNKVVHKFNKSLCEKSFIDKIFKDNGLNINLKESYNSPNICKSYHKLPEDLNLVEDKKKEIKEYSNNGNINDKNNITSDNDNDIPKLDNNNNALENEEEDFGLDNYSRIKDDFNLLYNKEYIHQINEDLLKLEIELFIEKMSELFSAYHIQMDEKILENQIIKRDYKKNIAKYLLYKKLSNKMQFIKSQQEIKKCNLKDNNIHLEKKNLENININLCELDILKFIFPTDNKVETLKKIVSIILKKNGNKKILDEK